MIVITTDYLKPPEEGGELLQPNEPDTWENGMIEGEGSIVRLLKKRKKIRW